jgi:hypothetical protein
MNYIIGIVLISLSVLSLPFSFNMAFGAIRYNQEIDVRPLTDLELEHISSVKEIFRSISYTEVEIWQYHSVTNGINEQPFNTMRIEIDNGINKYTGKMAFWGIKEQIRCSSKHVTATAIVFDETESAQKGFNSELNNLSGYLYGICEQGIDKDNRYFYTFLNRTREDSGGGWALTNSYTSVTVFQKENLVIIIEENTENRNDRYTNQYINLIAKQLTQL